MTDLMHPALEPIAWLLGTWTGEGAGIYPSIDDFRYSETLDFSHSGKPVIVYSSRTRALDDGRALHAESGYWRPQDDGTLEVVLAHSFGLVEVMQGTLEGRTIRLESVAFHATPTAKRVDGEARVITVDGDEMTYEMSLDFGGHGLQNHLKARLKRDI